MLLTKHVVHMGHFQNSQWSFTRNPFPRNYSTGNTSETTFLEYFVLEEQEKVSSEEEGSKRLYDVPFE